MRVIYVNTWPTKGQPWLLAGDVDPREAYLLARALERLGHCGDYAEAPRDWAPPRYYTITYTAGRKSVEIIEIRGGSVWRWPGGPWRRWLFRLLAEKLMDYYAVARCSLHSFNPTRF